MESRIGYVTKLIAPGLCALAGDCVAIGSINMLYASDTWQAQLNAYAAHCGCPGPYSVSGWGDGFILGATIFALAAIAVATWDVFTDFELAWPAIPLALPITFALWINAFSVSGSPMGDGDGAGLTGSAAVAIVRAGWLLFAALPLLAVVFLWLRSEAPEYSAEIPAGPRRV